MFSSIDAFAQGSSEGNHEFAHSFSVRKKFALSNLDVLTPCIASEKESGGLPTPQSVLRSLALVLDARTIHVTCCHLEQKKEKVSERHLMDLDGVFTVCLLFGLCTDHCNISTSTRLEMWNPLCSA